MLAEKLERMAEHVVQGRDRASPAFMDLLASALLGAARDARELEMRVVPEVSRLPLAAFDGQKVVALDSHRRGGSAG